MASLKDIQHAEPGSAHRVMWATGPYTLRAATRVSRIHIVTPESVPRTLCGVMIPLPSRHITPADGDVECARCTLPKSKGTR